MTIPPAPDFDAELLHAADQVLLRELAPSTPTQAELHQALRIPDSAPEPLGGREALVEAVHDVLRRRYYADIEPGWWESFDHWRHECFAAANEVVDEVLTALGR